MSLVNLMNSILGNLELNAECVSANQYRHLACFDLILNPGCRVKKIEGFSREIALGLKSKTEPIITTCPENGVVKVKVALSDSEVLDFNSVWSKTNRPKGTLPILLGESDNGEPLWVDFAKNPHTLIAGTTGSGKSVLLHVLIENALKRHDVKLFLVDPKQGVEFGCYEDNDNITLCYNYEQTVSMLDFLVKEMENRFAILKKMKLRSIDDSPDHFEKYFVIIDEVAELMMNDSAKNNKNKGRFENSLVFLAQKARAAGIYLVCATQRPSVDVLTGLIKANFPARISCKVNSSVDSKVILDSTGAESLLGKGDAILNNFVNGTVRFQVAFIKK